MTLIEIMRGCMTGEETLSKKPVHGSDMMTKVFATEKDDLPQEKLCKCCGNQMLCKLMV